MKKWMFAFTAGALMIAGCSNQKTTTETAEETGTKKMVPLPYTASYSSSFEMGDPAYTATILQGSWKDWEENKLDNMKNWMADTIVAFTSGNVMVKGVDSLMAFWKRDRAKYSSVIDTVDASMAVRSTDKKENWVLVWATEINTKPDGIKDTVSLQETWRINKDGKADYVMQFDRHKRK